MAKGKRKIIFEFNGAKLTQSDIDKGVYESLKEHHGIKYSDSIESYVNINEGMVYSVVNGTETIGTPLTSI